MYVARSLDSFSRHGKNIEPEGAVDAGDTAFFFYAGHGFEIAGQNFLLPTDVPAATEGQEELVRDASVLADRVIEIPNPYLANRSKRVAHTEGCVNVAIGTTLADAQREIILATLEHFEGDKQQTAQALGISLKTLYNRLLAYQGPDTQNT